MKKVICLVLAMLISLLSFTAFADAENSGEAGASGGEPVSIEVTEVPDETGAPQYILVVDSIAYSLPHPLYMENGRTMVEANTIASLIGITASVTDGFVTFTDGETIAKLSLTADGAILNDGSVVLDAYAAQKDEVVFVPLRFVAEGFGCIVDFSPVFTEENVFLGAYITIDTNKPSNVDFTLAIPDNLSELSANIIDITKTITGITPEITSIEADKYSEYVIAALLSGQKLMFIQTEQTAAIEGHNNADLLFDFASDDVDANSFSYGVKISDETLNFSVSKTVENTEEAVYFLSGMNELISSLTAPQE